MKFDILEALEILKDNFGNEAYLRLEQDDSTVRLSILVFREGNEKPKSCTYGLIFSREEIDKAKINIIKIKFIEAIKILKDKLI